MARTLIDGADQILAGSIGRASINTATTGSALITKIIAGTGITLSSTGVDAGTGDVTVTASGLSGYLPLTGGTLTGALSGTSVMATGSSAYLAMYPNLSAGYYNPGVQSGDDALIYSGTGGTGTGALMIAPWSSTAGASLRMTAAGASTLTGAGGLTLTSGLTATTGAFSGAVSASGLLSANNGFSINGASSVQPTLNITGGSTDQKLFDNYTTSTTIGWRFINDAQSASSVWLSAVRSGYAVTSINLNGGAINLTGATTVTGALSVSGTVSGAGITSLLSTYALTSAVPTGYASTPAMNGTGAAGTSVNWSHGDHVHPSDTSRYAASNPSGYQTAANITSTLASPPAIGGTAAAAGTFVALNATSGNVFNAIGRNRLDNGNMEIAQRALPTSGLSGYGIDRWIFSWSNATSGGMSRNNNTGYTSRYQANLSLINVVATGYMQFVQRIEAARSYDLAGQTVTVSWNTAYTISAGTTAFAVSLYYCAALDNWGGTTTLIGTTSFSPTSGGTTYTASFAVPSGAIYGLEVLFTATQSGSTGTLVWLMTSVQLEAGSVATPFERIDTSVNLTRCSYYYTTGLLYEVGYGPTGMYPAAANYVGWMRATPTIVITANYCSNLSGTSTLNYAAGSVFISGIYVTATGAYTINYDFSLTADL